LKINSIFSPELLIIEFDKLELKKFYIKNQKTKKKGGQNVRVFGCVGFSCLHSLYPGSNCLHCLRSSDVEQEQIIIKKITMERSER